MTKKNVPSKAKKPTKSVAKKAPTKTKTLNKPKSKKSVTKSVPEKPEPIQKVHIQIEVIVRDERAGYGQILETFKAEDSLISIEENLCPDDRFEYKFTTKNTTPLTIQVGEYKNSNPGDNGNFTTCVNDPADPPKIWVFATANLDLPDGTATMQLKYNGKMVVDNQQLDLKTASLMMFEKHVPL